MMTLTVVRVGWEFVQEGGIKGWVAVEPEACIAPPEGKGKPLKEVAGGDRRVQRARPVCGGLTQQAEGVDGVFSKSQPLWGCTPPQPHGKQEGWR